MTALLLACSVLPGDSPAATARSFALSLTSDAPEHELLPLLVAEEQNLLKANCCDHPWSTEYPWAVDPESESVHDAYWQFGIAQVGPDRPVSPTIAVVEVAEGYAVDPGWSERLARHTLYEATQDAECRPAEAQAALKYALSVDPDMQWVSGELVRQDEMNGALASWPGAGDWHVTSHRDALTGLTVATATLCASEPLGVGQAMGALQGRFEEFPRLSLVCTDGKRNAYVANAGWLEAPGEWVSGKIRVGADKPRSYQLRVTSRRDQGPRVYLPRQVVDRVATETELAIELSFLSVPSHLSRASIFSAIRLGGSPVVMAFPLGGADVMDARLTELCEAT